MKDFFINLYDLAKIFWGNKKNWTSWLILGIVIGIGVFMVSLNVMINDWNKHFYDAIAAFEVDKIFSLIREYLIYIGLYIFVSVYRTWLRKLLIIRWRKAMTDYFMTRWFSQKIFYKLAQKNKMDNPDQRIAEDIYLFAKYSLELTLSFLLNFVQLGSFLIILWNLSGAPSFNLFGYDVVIRGYLVWVALIYAFLGSVVTHIIGRKLHPLNYSQQVYEATFRGNLVRKSDQAEQIALYGGEQTEKSKLSEDFAKIAKNWRAIMDKERNLGFFTVGYSHFSSTLALLCAIPLLLLKIITFGGLMQIRSAFGTVLGSLSWFIYAYNLLPEWVATISRLSQFKKEMAEFEKHGSSSHQIQDSQASENAVSVKNLSIFTIEKQPLLQHLSFDIKVGEWVYLKGQSGLGKSSLLRTLSGIWMFYDGEYVIDQSNSLFIPQKSYLNSGSLTELLSYPNLPNHSLAQLNEVLAKVGLTKWQDRLDEVHPWNLVLSQGEQQRIIFARILLLRPTLLCLDEATANLDENSAITLMQLLRQHLPNSTIIFTSHQQRIGQFADREIDLTGYLVTD
ncbi:ABC transporter ATP-binding protein/permease [Ursidibacter maritimus]|uniref:ABC transporter ATP-binding protein/permease n=1 Tax=Ursidibacter maritimus TaxID=1331689 RepID=A0A949T505_9PAST|nr:ABC transporter ATP-binding protein/permease [Ursidibacter maritimus]KAE9538437.1 ABC transporter ATP-binding protein [Ursidibacter maritimus]MBV6523484.1 ABC transporter ATP-binding protein/permease [Ursidibacter maritimus]MBV6525831.1 ABC transporter ATP-binding protein/permease [Ursidibacter maritimus]MBV6528171.1 ABC transporter ATP-binding protein/permease [Ursidibacter maritimus]MBV6529302.1 ABC transporter ATP-binding protein/permease [Ursidibacter maritimus]